MDGNTAVDDEDAIGFLDIVLFCTQHFWILLLAPLIGAGVAYGSTFLISNTYTATARLLAPSAPPSGSAALATQLGQYPGLAGMAPLVRNSVDQYASLLKSRTVHDALVKRFHLAEVYDTRYLEDARNILARRSRIVGGQKDGIITIDVEDTDPKRAADIANGYVAQLRELSNTLAITEAAQRRLFFEQQLGQAKDNLARSEVALRGSSVSEAVLRTVPQTTLETLARLKAQITAQEIKLASMRTFMTDANPELKVATQELFALKAQLLKVEQSNGGKVTGDGAEYIGKFREFKYYETLFDLMAKQFEMARLDEARDGAIVQVVDRALPPEKKSKPNRSVIALIGGCGALLVTLLLILMRNILKDMDQGSDRYVKFAPLRRLFRIGGR